LPPRSAGFDAESGHLLVQIAPRTSSGKRAEKRCGFGGLRRRGENRLLVGLQNGKPRCEILGMIRARLVADAEIGAEESGPEFGNLS
jgi:hypothetical protein